MIKVKSSNSVIVSHYLMERINSPNFESIVEYDAQNPVMNDPRKITFIETDYSQCVTELIESTWQPLDGIIDNSYSDTLTTVSRQEITVFGDTFGPRFFFLILGSSSTLAVSGSLMHLSSEKIYCDVLPGKKLQIHRKTESARLQYVKQRNIRVVKGTWFTKTRLEFGDWEDLEEKETFYSFAEKMACVTDPELFQAED